MNSDENHTKKATARKLIDIFFVGCKVGFPLLGISVLVALIVPLLVADLPDKILTAKLTFTSLGLLFAVLQVFLGVLLALIGVTIDYDVDASVGPAKLKLASASPGILLILVGNLLFAFSLMREFEVTQATIETPAVTTTEDDSTKSRGGLTVPPLPNANGPE